jgi:glycosyltransferase involved in cell wall biosynthesis
MRSAPRVSVVTPFLDPPLEFFREAIESVLRQTSEDWELLLVNDGSGPEALEIARSYAETHPDQIRVIEHPHAENRGCSASRNLGVTHASGTIVAFLDADDVWLENRLSEHARLLEENPEAAMVCGPSLYWSSWSTASERPGGNEDFSPSLGVPSEVPLGPPGILPVFLAGRGAVPCPTAITVRRDRFLRIGGCEEAFRGLYEDQVFCAKMLLAYPVVVAGPVLDHYRQDPRSMMATTTPTSEREARRTFLLWLLAYIRDRGTEQPEVSQIARSELWNLDHPLGARVLRTMRRISGRVGGSRE